MAYNKREEYDTEITKGLIKTYRESISLIGENPDREGLLKTPERIAKAMQFMMQVWEMW